MVEAGVEAGALRYVRQPLGARRDGGQVVRLMERRQRHERLQIVEHRWRDDNRCGVARAAVDDAVADAEHSRAVKARAQPRREKLQRRGDIANLWLQRLRVEPRAGRIANRELRRRAEAFDLAARDRTPFRPVAHLVNAELQAGRSGVEHEHDRLAVDHDATLWKVCRRACAASTATAQLAIRERTLSARLVRMIGTRAPSTRPAQSALARNVSCLASMFPASRSGTSRMSGSPATGDAMPLILAASALIALSKASGPSSTAPVIWPRSAILQRAAASIVDGIFGLTISTAARMATFGIVMPSELTRSTAF